MEKPCDKLGEGLSAENSDLCERILLRYKNSSAPQHRHLCASAAAIRSILQEEGLPLTPEAYFAATISSIQDASAAEALDSDVATALSSFLSILLPLVSQESLPASKFLDATSVLVGLLSGWRDALSAATVRSVVKSIGLLLPFCSGEDWSAIELPLKTLLEFSVDRRPKVRKSAQISLETVFKPLRSSVLKKAGKLVLGMFHDYLPLLAELSEMRNGGGHTGETLSDLKHLQVLHMLNVLKVISPTFSEKVVSKLLSELCRLLGCHRSPLTRHIINIMEVLFQSSGSESLILEAENTISSVESYLSSSDKNPIDTLISALTLLKCCMDKLHGAGGKWIRNLSRVFNLIAGFLNSDDNVKIRATAIIRESIIRYFDRDTFLNDRNQLDAADTKIPESKALESICTRIVNLLNDCDGIPDEHTLSVISDLFLKLGDISRIFMKGILLKLAEYIHGGEDLPRLKHLQECLGSAVIAMGPENILSLIPISLHSKKLICSNTWLIPILKKYVFGSSLKYFMEHIAPLAESIEKASAATSTTMVCELQTHALGLWDLLPAFCRYPVDACEMFESLAKQLVVLLNEPYMHATIAEALQELVNQNKSIMKGKLYGNESKYRPIASEFGGIPSHYSKKTASRNIRALASCSMGLIETLTRLFFYSPPEKRLHLKEAIGCLASITDSSKLKIFFKSLEKSQLIERAAEAEKLNPAISKSIDSEKGANPKELVEAWRPLIIDLASSLVEGADEDFVNIIYDYIKPSLEVTAEEGQSEAYYALSRIFVEHEWFISSRFNELVDFLLSQKPLTCVISQRGRFTCLHFLLVHYLKSDLKENVDRAFQILNEIILTLKDSKLEVRRAAYDALIMITSSLKSLSSEDSETLLHQLFNMLIGYLSGSSPHVMSGAVSALSLLIYEDPSFWFSVPDLMPSILVLLQAKAQELIKAVLGFVKVLVLSLKAKDLQKTMKEIVNGVLPWSSVSQNHFRTKIKIIMEIIIRKCGSGFVELVIPEKYKRFFKVISERQGKKISEAADGPDAGQKLRIKSHKGSQKRKSNELRTQPSTKEKETQYETSRVKRRKTRMKGNPTSGRAGQSNKHAKPSISGMHKREGIRGNRQSGLESEKGGIQRNLEANRVPF